MTQQSTEDDELEKWVSNNSTQNTKDIYHTNKNCSHLPDGEDNKKQPTESELKFHEMEECSRCKNNRIEDEEEILNKELKNSEPFSDTEWASLTLNPYCEKENRDGEQYSHLDQPFNPVCPLCEEKIQAIENEVERRFVCGCDNLRTFKFETKE